MKKDLLLVTYGMTIMALLLFASRLTHGQSLENEVIQLMATAPHPDSGITLSWQPLSSSPSADSSWYYIHRKTKAAYNWDTLAMAGISDTTYTDVAAIGDIAYEYYVLRAELHIDTYYIPKPPPDCPRCPPGPDTIINSFISNHQKGYIYAGNRAPAIHSRGTLLLIVDTEFTDSCAKAIQQLADDIAGDGWNVIRYDIPRTMPDTSVRSLIRKEHLANRAGITAVLILGHIAVPYSGNLAPDGHPDHRGAWAADIYYGDVHPAAADTFWTDFLVNSTTATRPQNHNIPGDGKWDQSWVFTAEGISRLQVSRIDFSGMTVSGKTEIQLMQNYLARAHAYKTGLLDMRRQALIDDNFSPLPSATCGWRNFSTLVGRNAIHETDLISSLRDSSFQWAYGCGPGTYTSAGGIGTTADFMAGPVNGIFMLLYGSYFGDWDSQNNFLRAPLCAPVPALTSCWASGGGRGDWFFQHMALGENIGYSAMLAHSKRLEYYRSNTPEDSFGQTIEQALMGDLTLRTDYIRQPENLVLSACTPGDSGCVRITWNASPDTGVNGYYIYRSATRWGNYQQIAGPVSGTSYDDSGATAGKKYYMIRPVKLETTPSGTYYNLGIGIIDTVPDYGARPAQIVAGTDGDAPVRLYPNPVTGMVYLVISMSGEGTVSLDVLDQSGRVVHAAGHSLPKGAQTISLDLRHLPPGYYVLRVHHTDGIWTTPFIRQN